MLNLNHKKLTVWKKGIELVKEVYKLTEGFPPEEKFGLVNQMRRASISVVSNISEGASRKSEVERKRFFEIARSSLVELDTQVEISNMLNHISNDAVSKLDTLMNECFALLTSMIKN